MSVEHEISVEQALGQEMPADPFHRGDPPDTATEGPRAPEFDEEALEGIRDYWALYERHFDEIRTIILTELADDPEVGRIISKTPPATLEEQGKISRDITARAIETGDWEPYVANLRSQGTVYANLGLSFGAWFRVVSAFRPHIVRHLLVAFATDTHRLARAIVGMHRLMDLALSVIGEAYLAAQEEVIARQREAMGEMRARSRYQVVLASIADGVVTTDPYGNVVTTNPAMERITGIPAEEAIGHRYDSVYPTKREGRLLEWEERFIYQAIREGGTILSEGMDVHLVGRDGREVPVSITAAPIVEEGGRIVGGVAVIRERPSSGG